MKKPTLFDEPALIGQWQRGSETAFEALYLHHVLPLLRQATAKLGSRALAEELVQDTFLALLDQKARVDPSGGLGGYLAVILRRKVYSHYRQQLLQNSLQSHLWQHFDEADRSTEHDLDFAEVQQLIREEVSRLPAQCQRVYKLSREQELSHQEIAEHLGISYHTVEQHIRRALRSLRGRLHPYSWLLLFLGLYH